MRLKAELMFRPPLASLRLIELPKWALTSAFELHSLCGAFIPENQQKINKQGKIQHVVGQRNTQFPAAHKRQRCINQTLSKPHRDVVAMVTAALSNQLPSQQHTYDVSDKVTRPSGRTRPLWLRLVRGLWEPNNPMIVIHQAHAEFIMFRAASVCLSLSLHSSQITSSFKHELTSSDRLELM